MRCASSRRLGLHLIVTGLILTGCQATDKGRDGNPVEIFFEDMGPHVRAITTSSPDAQRFFNQGLTWAYAFNHDEAIRSFHTAARYDPMCAMAYWGIALCNGPHINNPVVDEQHAAAAWEAVEKAQSLADRCSPPEKALITSLAQRYANPQPPDRRQLDESYAAAMEAVWRENRDDPDIGTLYAESLMDLQPWDLWTREGQPKGRTPEILTVLEGVLDQAPNHPGANHLYIHAVEASSTPEKGVASADRLRTLVPMSGHLTHMPSHIDVQTGRWAAAADQNEAAIRADRRYRTLSPRQGFYNAYMAHNHHFLAFAAMMEGREKTALAAAREMIANIPDEFLRAQPQFVDPMMMIVIDVYKRFGRWDAMLNEPKPAKNLPITISLWHAARGVAFAAKRQIDEAVREQEAFRAAVKRVPPDALMAINPAHTVLSIADEFLAGEIAYHRGEIEAAVTHLRKAVAIEDSLLYMEPPDWIQPVRHALGAILLDAGRVAEAEAVYREDLKIWPENGWSLYGLSRCLDARGAREDAAGIRKRFEEQWARADHAIGASCLCVSAAAK